jgi:hypothetical protein
MTVRPEVEFNTLVYNTEDRFRGISVINVELMNKKDMTALGLPKNGR